MGGGSANASSVCARAVGHAGKRTRLTVQDVADHIDRVKKLVGVDHVGIGSDYDGWRNFPVGLEDTSTYPNLIEELLKRNYSREEIKKIFGGNLLRVWNAVENFSKP